MKAEPTGKSVGQRDADVDGDVLDALLAQDAQRPWSEQEIARMVGDPVLAADSLGRLARAGLIHRLDGFVFASRAALHADQVMLQNELSA